jgi:hypothetical protein
MDSEHPAVIFARVKAYLVGRSVGLTSHQARPLCIFHGSIGINTHAASLDQLIGVGEHSRRYGNSKRGGGLKIDHEFDLR